jgi:hypothetical protein
MRHIAGFSAKALKLKNGQEIFLAREKHPEFIKKYAQYAMK